MTIRLSWVTHTDMLEKQAIREGVAALYGEKAALQNQLAAERRAHAEELTAVKEAADKDALFSSMTRMMTGSAPLEPVHAEKPKSLLQEARAQRVAEREDLAGLRRASSGETASETGSV